MESSSTFQTEDDKRRRKCRILYKQKRDKESLQQKQARLAKQRKYYRQRRAKMTQEEHTALLLQNQQRYGTVHF